MNTLIRQGYHFLSSYLHLPNHSTLSSSHPVSKSLDSNYAGLLSKEKSLLDLKNLGINFGVPHSALQNSPSKLFPKLDANVNPLDDSELDNEENPQDVQNQDISDIDQILDDDSAQIIDLDDGSPKVALLKGEEEIFPVPELDQAQPQAQPQPQPQPQAQPQAQPLAQPQAQAQSPSPFFGAHPPLSPVFNPILELDDQGLAAQGDDSVNLPPQGHPSNGSADLLLGSGQVQHPAQLNLPPQVDHSASQPPGIAPAQAEVIAPGQAANKAPSNQAPQGSADAANVADASAPAKDQLPVKLDPAKELERIQKLAKDASNNDQPSQEVLADMLSSFKKFPDIYSDFPALMLKAELVKDPNGKQYAVEPIQFPGIKRVFYGMTVNYTVTAKHKDGSPDTVIQYVQKINTNANFPEDAILLGLKYKDHICELAKSKAEVPNLFEEGHVQKEYLKNAYTSKEFTFNFSSHPSGRISHLENIQINAPLQQSKTLSYNLANHHSQKYAYDFKEKTTKAIDLEYQNEPLFGKMILDSEDELSILQNGYYLKYDEFLEKTLMDESFQTFYATNIEKNVKEKIDEFEKVKANFIKNSFFKFLKKDFFKFFKSGVNFTPEFDQIQIEAKAFQEIKGGNYEFNKDEFSRLSPGMQQYIQLNSNIELDQMELQKLKNEMAQLKALNPPKPEGDPGDGGLPGVSEKQLTILTKYQPLLKDPKILPALSQPINLEILKEFLSLLEEKETKLSKETKEKEEKLKTFQTSISQEQTYFNDQLEKLIRVHRDLKGFVEEIEEMKKRAEMKLGDKSPIPMDHKKKVEHFLNVLPDHSKLKGKLANNEKVIQDILDRLKVIGVNPMSNKVLKVFQ